jgi:hypothetical protein
MPGNVEITSIRDRDLRPILKEFELDRLMDEGALLCDSCSRTLTWDNLGGLLVKDGTIVPFCDLAECLASIQEPKD